MNIEKFYYDEQTEMYEQMKKEQDEYEQSLSVEEREKAERKKKEEYQIINPVKYQRFIYLSERAIQFSKISGCNIKIQTFPDMSALIKMQTGYIWLLSDGESALEDKETMKNLLNEADWVGIGSKKHGEKDVVELEFWFELAEKLKK